MAYSFTKIEQDKSKTIGFVFSFLVVFYFLTAYLIVVVIHNYLQYQSLGLAGRSMYQFQWLTFLQTMGVLVVAIAIGFFHWVYSTTELINKIIKVLGAERLNPHDTYHQKFQNIIDEVSVATGGRKIDGAVIPTMAMNAFALADFQGRAVIGVTEGLLARLSRAQLEAVVGHEAAHIVSGDCLSTTVSSSMFELYSGALRAMELMFRGTGRRRYYSGRGGGGGVILLLVFIYLMLFVTKFMSQLIRMFISREREYRADAVAVRLTRDPISLAQALYGMAYRWRGVGLSAEELEAIFIINPRISFLDEQDGTWSDLFATHPPIENRIRILLNMARTDLESVRQAMEAQANQPRVPPPGMTKKADRWMVNHQGKWEGPYELLQLMTLAWLTPNTFVQKWGYADVMMVYEDKQLQEAIIKKKGLGGGDQCPKCHVSLGKAYYEGVEVGKCSLCGGTLVCEKDVQRIILREEVGFSDRIRKMADVIQKEYLSGKTKPYFKQPNHLYHCPKCAGDNIKMLKSFYTAAYHVEVDRCFSCKHIWFDADELEVLQYLIESGSQK